MVAKYSVGKSSYGDLRGVTQYVASERMALQVLSTIIDFNAYLRSKGRGGSLSVNEGMRSRDRQMKNYIYYLAHGYPVAAYCTWGPPPRFTSRHDEVNNGNAVDFGVTNADGSNRALSADEFTRLHEIVQGRGGTWTGVNFGEPWHHEMATRAEAVPPYADARARLAPKPVKPAKPQPIKAKPAPVITSQEDTMLYQSIQSKTWYLVREFTVQATSDKTEAVLWSRATKKSVQASSTQLKKMIADTADRRTAVFGSIDSGLQKLLDDRNL